MKLLRITVEDRRIYYVLLEPWGNADPLFGDTRPVTLNFPDAVNVELLDMTESQYHAIEATIDSAERFSS